jgi:hypothetical protein
LLVWNQGKAFGEGYSKLFVEQCGRYLCLNKCPTSTGLISMRRLAVSITTVVSTSLQSG